MFIGVRLEPDGTVYIAKQIYKQESDVTEENNSYVYDSEIDVYTQPPYNFKRVEVDDVYEDCINQDFNENLTFNVEKYNARKQKEIDQLRIAEITLRLEKLDQDFRQVDLGAIIPDIAERKAEFITLHNELRVLLGKPPREYTKTLA